MRIFKPLSLSLPLTLSACVLVTDFGETDDQGDTGGLTDAHGESDGDGADGDADVPAPVATPSLQWFSILEHSTDFESYYVGLDILADGQVVVAGGGGQPGTDNGAGVVHRYSSAGSRDLELEHDGTWMFHDVCQTPDGRVYAVTRGLATGPKTGAFGIVEFAPDGSLMAEAPFVPPGGEANPVGDFARIVCDDQGEAWVSAVAGLGPVLLNVGAMGSIDEQWPMGEAPRGRALIAYDDGLLHVALYDRDVPGTQWQQRDATGSIVAEIPLAHTVVDLEVRGSRAVIRNSDDVVISYDLAGNEQWSFDITAAVPEPFDGPEMALGPSGEVLLSAHDEGTDTLAIIDGQGALAWTEALTPLGSGSEWISVIESAIDDDGVISLVGVEGWTGTPGMNGMPGEPGMQRAWIARYAAP
ncbi:MAG: hypothetical protein AAF799_18300 [Myxococcota bacterium]